MHRFPLFSRKKVCVEGSQTSHWLVLAITILCFFKFFPVAIAQEGPEYESGVVVVQFDSTTQIASKTRRTGLAGFDRLASKYEVHTIERVYPFLDYVLPTPKTRRNLFALRRTYYVRYHAGQDPVTVAGEFSSASGVVYAEPVVVNRLYAPDSMELADPNDPGFRLQSELGLLRLPQAWDEVKSESGRPKVVIAIVDNGGEWRHEDLRANVWTNEDEIPDNGVDDDQNGFIDDVHGVNFSNGNPTNNDPTRQPELSGNPWHGTATAGAAGAVTNNSIGVAGASWNASLMHINASDPSGLGLRYGYSGVLYAAVNGADIINASWGGRADSDMAAQLIDQTLHLATDLGSLIVTSAGNSQLNIDPLGIYPARHLRVLSVGATEKTTARRASFSNYGKLVDVFAPGVSIVTTGINDGYIAVNGTSLASPIVAGIAALIKTKFPDMTPDAVREKIRVSAESIDLVNPDFAGQLGRGVVNAFAAIQETNHSGVRLKRWSWEDHDGNHAIASGDEVTVTAVFTNHLADARRLTVELESDEPYPFLQVHQAEADVGFLRGGDSTEMTFQFRVNIDAPQNQRVHFYVRVRTEGTDDISDMLSFRVNRSLDVIHQSLSALYTATGGDQWHNNENWDLTKTPNEQELDQWHGISMLGGWIHSLRLSQNNLKGMLPSELVGLSELQVLSLARNSLSGSIPDGLNRFSELRELILAYNSFSGTIPPELGELAKLEWLNLYENSFSGPIPSSLGNLANLKSLDLDKNMFMGSIPPELGNLSELEWIGLGENALTGSIPPELGSLSKLIWLDLGENALTGSIPLELGNLSDLETLDLSHNSLSGMVPSELGNLSQLDSLKLSHNTLVGRLPRSFMQLDSLKVFWFDGQYLCAPQDDEFQAWLKSIADVKGGVCSVLEFVGGIEDQRYAWSKPITPLILPEAIKGAGPIKYTLTPSLPEGLEFDTSTRKLSGTPTMITSSPIEYTYRAMDAGGSTDSLLFQISVYSLDSVVRESLPEVFEALGNFPNPFQAVTRLTFDLPQDARVQVEVMDVIGRRLFTVPENRIAAGWSKTIELNGESLPAGLYLYRLIADLPLGRAVQVGRFVRIP